MKRVATGIVLGAVAGVIGVIVFDLTNQQIWGWLATAVLLGIVSQLPHPAAAGRWLWLGVLGGCIITVCYLLSRIVVFPIVAAWPLLGAVLGFLSARSTLGWRITGSGAGLLAGTLGMGILYLITLIILPVLGLPTTFDFDMDMLGLVITGVFIGGTIAWLREK
jgi:hypothetical protein